MVLTSWRTFVVVCRLGSLSAAAAELGYTQSAVSRQIAGLEQELGVALVQRHVRGVHPTPAGEVFRHHAVAALNEADRAMRAAREVRDGAPGRPLAVGATPSLAAGIVPAAIRRLLDHGGPLRWSLLPGLSSELHDRMIAGELDVAFVTDAPPGLPEDARLDRRLLGIDEMVVVVPLGHPQAARGPVHIRELADETWVEDNDGSAALLRRHAARAGFSARIDLSAVDLTGKTALVATGHAVALVPGVLSSALRSDVTPVPLVDPPTRGVYALSPRRDPHPSAALLVAQLATAFGSSRSNRSGIEKPGQAPGPTICDVERSVLSGGHMSYAVDFENVSTVGLESSPVAETLAGLRANEARYFKNKYDHVFTVSPVGEAPEVLDWVNRVLSEERDIVISARPLEVTSFEVDGIRMAYVFYESGLSINVMYGIEDGAKRAVGFKLSEGMEVPEELESRFKFARQKSKLAGVIRGSFFVIKGEY